MIRFESSNNFLSLTRNRVPSFTMENPYRQNFDEDP